MLQSRPRLQVKWLTAIVTGKKVAPKKKKVTPIPPKPYDDFHKASNSIDDPRYYKEEEYRKHIDPEKPHWKDGRFESRTEVPFFDIFGFNRDWSWTLFKVCAMLVVCTSLYEIRMIANDQFRDIRVNTKTEVSAIPDYARNDVATEKELADSGYTYVGVTQLSNLGVSRPKKDE